MKAVLEKAGGRELLDTTVQDALSTLTDGGQTGNSLVDGFRVISSDPAWRNWIDEKVCEGQLIIAVVAVVCFLCITGLRKQ